MFVTVIWFYFLNHAIGRVTGRSPFGSYAAVRHEPKPQSPLGWALRSAALVVFLSLAVTMKRTEAHLESLVGKIPHHQWGSWAG